MEVTSLLRGSGHVIFFYLQLLSLVGNKWLQCCLLGQLSRYLLNGYGIFCILYLLLLVVVVMCYVL